MDGASRLRALRLARGWTQKNLARRSGVCSRTISYVECGQSKPRAPTRRKLLAAFGIAFSRQDETFGELR